MKHVIFKGLDPLKPEDYDEVDPGELLIQEELNVGDFVQTEDNSWHVIVAVAENYRGLRKIKVRPLVAQDVLSRVAISGVEKMNEEEVGKVISAFIDGQNNIRDLLSKDSYESLLVEAAENIGVLKSPSLSIGGLVTMVANMSRSLNAAHMEIELLNEKINFLARKGEVVE